MRRRAFIEGIAALVTAWPFAVRAQQSTTVRRVGVLMNYRADEPEGQARVKAFTQGRRKLGWSLRHAFTCLIYNVAMGSLFSAPARGNNSLRQSGLSQAVFKSGEIFRAAKRGPILHVGNA